MSPAEFWELSWYEWSLYSERQKLKTEKQNFDFQNQWHQTRIIWATIINRHRGKEEPATRPEDLITLSLFDQKPVEQTPIDPEESFKKLGKVFKRDAE